MKRRFPVFIALILVLSLALGACASADEEIIEPVRPTAEELSEVKKSLEHTETPALTDFNALTLMGEPVTEELFAGHKLTMINIWGTFCNPCIAEMPDLARLNTAYEEGEFQVVGLIIDTLDTEMNIHPGAVEAAWAIIDATGAEYTHLLPADDLIYAALLNVSAVPETLFVDSMGNVLTPETRYLGARSYDDWKGIVDSLLASLPEE